MLIRQMSIDDYNEVCNLWLNTQGMGLNTADDSKTGIERYLSRNPNTCFVAEQSDEIIGAILSGHDGRRGLIYHLAVKASHRERGTGSALLDHSLQALKREGIGKVYIMVFKENDAGNAFWEKRGFTVPETTIYRAKELIRIDHIDMTVEPDLF